MKCPPFMREGLSVRELQEEVNKLFDRFWHAGITAGPFDGQEWAPAIDLLDEADRFVLRAEVPGLESNDVEVSLSGQVVTLKGNKAADRPEAEARNLLRAERRFGRFSRSVPLPAGVDASQVTATCRKGVLEVILPKQAEARAKTIHVEIHD